MFSEDDYFYGQRKYTKQFDQLSEFASSVFGLITQCAIVEVHKSGHILWIANRPDFAEAHFEHKRHLSDPLLVYADNLKEGLSTFDASQNLNFLYDNEVYVGKKLDILHGFYRTEKISDTAFRHYIFSSSTQDTYKRVIENSEFIDVFLKYFKDETKDILQDVGEYKVDMADAKGASYFVKPSTTQKTKKDQFIELLHKYGILKHDLNLSNREFQCMVLYCKGYTSKLAGTMLNISHHTVENHLASLRNKLFVSKKSELLYKLGQIMLPK